MSCPRCGDVCRCDSEFRAPQISDRGSRPRFEVNAELVRGSTVLVDPEAYDRSEERFSESLSSTRRPKFVIEDEVGVTDAVIASTPAPATLVSEPEPSASHQVAVEATGTAAQSSEEIRTPDNGIAASPNDAANSRLVAGIPTDWKDEVAARLNSYRARRKPKPPRYPSLRLKFDLPEPRARYAEPAEPPVAPVVDSPVTYDAHALAPETAPRERMYTPAVETARIIEFPRSHYGPAAPTYELADPVADGPRILEVPEIAPPGPALGGIILASEEKEPEKRPGFEIPLQTPSMSRRAFAMAIDGAIVAAACVLFGYIVLKIVGRLELSLAAIETLAAVTAIFWSGYQYLLLIYTGSTPGLRMARLRLSQFDGSPVSRRLRQWRVLASILSAGSLGLGFAWSYLDEDALCWHDRITRTYLAAAP